MCAQTNSLITILKIFLLNVDTSAIMNTKKKLIVAQAYKKMDARISVFNTILLFKHRKQ